MREKIRRILTDKTKLIYSIVTFIVIGLVLFIVHKYFSDKFSMARALKILDGGYEYYKRYNTLLPIVIILRIILMSIVLVLAFLSYKFFELRDKAKQSVNINEGDTKENTTILNNINKKYFNIIVIILLIFPLIHCFSEAYKMIDRLENQIEIVSLTEEIASYNNYLGYSYRNQVKYEKFELVKKCFAMLVYCVISIVSTIIIAILSYKTIIIIKNEHFSNGNKEDENMQKLNNEGANENE